MSETSEQTDMSVSNYRTEMKYIKTKSELEIDEIKKYLATLPPKNIRKSRKDADEAEIKRRNHESTRISQIRKKKMDRLEELINEAENMDYALKFDDMKVVNDMIDAKREIGDLVNKDIQDERDRYEIDWADAEESKKQLELHNSKLEAKIDEYKKALQTLMRENEALKQKANEPPKYINNSFGYEIPSTMFPRPQQSQYINSY